MKTKKNHLSKLSIFEINNSKLNEIKGGDNEWVLAGCLISPVAGAFTLGYYLEYNS